MPGLAQWLAQLPPGWLERIQTAFAGMTGGQGAQGGMPSGDTLRDPAAWGQWKSQARPLPAAEEGGMMQGAYLGDEDGAELHIPLGEGRAIVFDAETTKRLMKGRKDGSKAKGPKKMAAGGTFDSGNAGRSIFEGLLDDTDRTRSRAFLDQAAERATYGTPFTTKSLPTPIGVSAPGTSRFLSDLVASLNAISRGVPQEYFREQAALLRPAGYSEGVIGRSR